MTHEQSTLPSSEPQKQDEDDDEWSDAEEDDSSNQRTDWIGAGPIRF